MIRRAVMAVLPLLFVTGCGGGEPEPSFWLTAPGNDDQRLEAMRRTRAIDPCALLPRAQLEKLGTLLSVSTKGPESCAAVLDSTDRNTGTALTWSAFVGTTTSDGRITRTTVADVPVELLDADLPANFEYSRDCIAKAQFPAGVTLRLQVRTPSAGNPCDLATRQLAPAIAEWQREPAQGTSPDTVRTVLTGVDPCDVLSALGVDPATADRSLRSCEFTYRDTPIALHYDYMERGLVTGTEPVDLNSRHAVYREAPDTPELYTIYSAVVGPEINPSTADPLVGPLVPSILISGPDDEVVREVLRRTLTLFP
ncbi:hypothetical protein ACWIGI_31105 [Nocardia sp. NPDC055321]